MPRPSRRTGSSSAAAAAAATTNDTNEAAVIFARDPRLTMDLSYLDDDEEVESSGNVRNGKTDLLLYQSVFRPPKKPASDSTTKQPDDANNDKDDDGQRPATPTLQRSTDGKPSPPDRSPSNSGGGGDGTMASEKSPAEASCLTPEEVQRADERAQALVSIKFDAASYANLGDVFWCQDKRSFYPVVLLPLAERMAKAAARGGSDRTVTVLFLGYNWSGSWGEGEYPRTSLKPFYYDPATKKSSSAKKAAKAQMEAPPAGDPEWNPRLLRRHLSYLSNQSAFKGPTGLYDRRVEESFLKLSLLQIQKNQQQKEEEQRAPLVSASFSYDNDDGDDDVDDDRGEGADSAVNDEIRDGEVEPGEVMAPPQPLVVLPSSASLQPRRSERVRATTAAAPPSGKRVNATTRPRLRAGDQIKYIPFICTADKKNVTMAYVTAVFSKKQDIVVELSDGALLTKEQQVNVVQRWKGGKHVPTDDESYIYLENFILDPSNNGKFDCRSRADAMHELVAEGARQVEATILESLRGATSSRKRPRDDGTGEAAENLEPPMATGSPTNVEGVGGRMTRRTVR